MLVMAVASEADLKVLKGGPARVVMRVEEGGVVAAASFSGLPLDVQARRPPAPFCCALDRLHRLPSFLEERGRALCV